MMKKFIKKNEILGMFTDIDGAAVQGIVDALQKILKEDPEAVFDVCCRGADRLGQLSVNYKEAPKEPCIRAAWHARADNRKNITAETICGCAKCLSIFKGNKITGWIGYDLAQAVCPFCEAHWVIPGIEDAQYLMDINAFYMNKDVTEFQIYDRADDALDLGRGALNEQ